MALEIGLPANVGAPVWVVLDASGVSGKEEVASNRGEPLYIVPRALRMSCRAF